MANDKKITCPDCETENAADATKCSKCELPFIIEDGKISMKDFFRILDVREKQKTKKKETGGGFRLW